MQFAIEYCELLNEDEKRDARARIQVELGHVFQY